MDIKGLKYDCLYFKGDMPCVPNKLRDKVCFDCDEYTPIDKRILIIKLGAIGDVIRTTPLLQKYRSIYPNCRITWVTNSPDILPKGMINEIRKFDASSYALIRNLDFDIAVNLDKDKEACVLLKESNAPEKYGYSWSDDNHIAGLNAAADNKILTGLFDNYSKLNTKSYQQEIFEICGFEFNNEPNFLDVSPVYSNKWESIKELAKGRKIIGLNTGCGGRWPTRLWKTEYWQSLINSLNSEGYFPIVLGGVDEDPVNKFYAETTGVYYPGTYSLQEFIAIVDKCDVIVTAVSMAMHIASGLGKPIVLFNNIFNKNEFELYGRGEIIEPPSGCDCYYGSTCTRDIHCMTEVTPPAVLSSVKTTIAQMS
jgi:ADP-heptose:LPS heptosyltransferase